MYKAALVSAYLACIGHGRRVQQIPMDRLPAYLSPEGQKPIQGSHTANHEWGNEEGFFRAGPAEKHFNTRSISDPLKAFAARLLELRLAAAFSSIGPGALSRVAPHSSTSRMTVSNRWHRINQRGPVMTEVPGKDKTTEEARDCAHQARQAIAAPPTAALLLSFIPFAVMATAVSSPEATSADLNLVAQLLGYVVGAGSLLLYAPIIWRVARQDDADGLALSTWWLKLSAYTATDLYCVSRGFPFSAFVETAVISVESAVLLVLVAWKQDRLLNGQFAALLTAYISVVAWASLAPAPAEVLALGQASSSLLTTAALVPQLVLNSQRRDPGGYSPLTAGLACVGCMIRLFTTTQLAGGDPILLAGFGLGLTLNGGLLAQILYYGLVVQEMPLLSLLGSDFTSASSQTAKAGQDGE